MLPWELCRVESGCQYSTFQLHWTIGIVIGAVIFGALLTLGMSCVRLLAPLDGKRLLQLRLLRVYVISLMLINTIYGVENFLWSNFLSIFGDEVQERRFFASIQLACTFTMVLVGVLTDGLLVSISIIFVAAKERMLIILKRCGDVTWYSESSCLVSVVPFGCFVGYFLPASG